MENYENRCPNCGGTISSGKCQYCDTEFSEMSSPTPSAGSRSNRWAAVAVVIAAALLLSFGFVIFRFVRTAVNQSSRNPYVPTVKYTGSSTARGETADRIAIYREKGAWCQGTYKIGDEIPEGTYLAVFSGEAGYGDFVANVTADAEGNESLGANTWGHFSKYLTIRKPGYLELSWCILYDISKSRVVNDPREHPGMFLCGRDIDPGTYELIFDERFEELDSSHSIAKYTIYTDADAVAPSIRTSGSFRDNNKITLKEGDFVELYACRIK